MVWTLIVQGLYLDRTHLELLDVGGHHTATSEKKEEFVRMRGLETEIFERQSNSTSRNRSTHESRSLEYPPS